MTLLGAFEQARHFHRDEKLLAFARRPLGQCCVFAAAVALLLPLPPREIPVEVAVAGLALCFIFPERRNLVLSYASIALLVHWIGYGWRIDWRGLEFHLAVALALVAAIVLAVCAAVFWSAIQERTANTWLRRHANPIWHLAVWAVVLATPANPVFGSAMVFLAWRVGYSLRAARRGATAGSRFRDHMFYFWPLWSTAAVPSGKGYEYLRNHAATNRSDLAASQLAGIKLIALAWILLLAERVLDAAVYAEPGLVLDALRGSGVGFLDWPRLSTLIAENDASIPIAQRWAQLFPALVSRTLEIAIGGHVAIGVLRLCGYNVFRNTYKPLLAESVVEFWNRFFFYFKELLVEFFFLPTDVRYFKKRPRLRMFAATFASAGLGNLYFHLLDFAPTGMKLQPADWFDMAASRGVYCSALSVGIFVSMLREQKRRGAPPPPGSKHPLRRLRRIAGVWLFFALIYVYSSAPVALAFEDRNAFFWSLFGV